VTYTLDDVWFWAWVGVMVGMMFAAVVIDYAQRDSK
jgi:hypothetical protein